MSRDAVPQLSQSGVIKGFPRKLIGGSCHHRLGLEEVGIGLGIEEDGVRENASSLGFWVRWLRSEPRVSRLYSGKGSGFRFRLVKGRIRLAGTRLFTVHLQHDFQLFKVHL